MKNYDDLKKILLHMLNAYKDLLSVLQQEKYSLVNLEMDNIDHIIKEKDTLLLKLRLLEEERQRILKTEKMENKKILNIYEETKDLDLKNIHSTLLSLMQAIEEVNSFNRILIERSIDFLKLKMKFLECAGINKGKNSLVSMEF